MSLPLALLDPLDPSGMSDIKIPANWIAKESEKKKCVIFFHFFAFFCSDNSCVGELQSPDISHPDTPCHQGGIRKEGGASLEGGWVSGYGVTEVHRIDEWNNSQSVGGISHSVVKGKSMCVERHRSRPLLLLLTSTASGFPISPQLAGETGCAPVSAAILGFVNPKDLIFTPPNRHPTNWIQNSFQGLMLLIVSPINMIYH